MKNYRKCFAILLTAFIAISAYAQNPDQSVLDLWNKNDIKYDGPHAGNPLLPGYFADPFIFMQQAICPVGMTLLNWRYGHLKIL
jgi:hypothetical protein